jgi:predicted dehydrogenase
MRSERFTARDHSVRFSPELVVGKGGIMPGTPTRPSRSNHLDEDAPRIALIGCGAIANEYYLPALTKYPAVLEQLILVDRNQDQAKKMAAKFNVNTWVVDYKQVLGEVDGAIIAVPTHLHYPIGMEFLCHGVPVLCEKPLAESGDRALELVEQACRYQVPLAVNYLQRLIPSFATVKEMLDRRALGAPQSIHYGVAEDFRWPTVSGFYFNSPLSSRGVLRDRGAHAIDHICWWLGGKPRLIACHHDAFGGSEAVACVKFEHGDCKGTVRLSWLAAGRSTFEVVCERGTVQGNVYDYLDLWVTTGKGRKQHIKCKSAERSKTDIARRVVGNFVDVVRRKAEPLVAGANVLDSIEFIDECYAAAVPFKMPWYEIVEAPSVA